MKRIAYRLFALFISLFACASLVQARALEPESFTIIYQRGNESQSQEWNGEDFDLPADPGLESWICKDFAFAPGTPVQNGRLKDQNQAEMDLASLSEESSITFQARPEDLGSDSDISEIEEPDSRKDQVGSQDSDDQMIETQAIEEENIPEDAEDPYTADRLREVEQMKAEAAAGLLDWGEDPEIELYSEDASVYAADPPFFTPGHQTPNPYGSEAYAYLDKQEHLLVFNRGSAAYVAGLKNTSRFTYFTNFENREVSAGAIPWRPLRAQIYRVNFLDTIHPLAAWQFFGWQQNTVAYNHLERLDLSRCACADGLFYENTSLPSIDISGINCSGVKTSAGWFYNDSSITQLKCAGMNWPACELMKQMFYNCSSLLSIDLTGWNTPAMTNAYNMFAICSSLKNLDVTPLNVSKCTNMGGFVRYCYALESIDLGGWDTGACLSLNQFFYGDKSLTTLDINHFNTENVTDLANCFLECSGLKELDLSNWKTPKMTSARGVFQGCSSLESLDISSMDTSHVTNGQGLKYFFDRDYFLRSINFSDTFTPWGLDKSLISTDLSKVALLPTPTAEAYPGLWSGNWWRAPQQDDAMTPAEWQKSYDGSTMAGLWRWQPYAGISVAFDKTIDAQPVQSAQAAETFRFELWNDTECLQTADSNANGQVTFKPLQYSRTGSYSLQIREVLTEEQKKQYEEPEPVNVSLTVSATEDDWQRAIEHNLPKTFNNSHKPSRLTLSQTILYDGKEMDLPQDMDGLPYTVHFLDQNQNPVESVAAHDSDGTDLSLHDGQTITLKAKDTLELSVPAGTRWSITSQTEPFDIEQKSFSGTSQANESVSVPFVLTYSGTCPITPEVQALMNGRPASVNEFSFEFSWPEQKTETVSCKEEGIGIPENVPDLSYASHSDPLLIQVREIRGNNPAVQYDSGLIVMEYRSVLNPDWTLSAKESILKDGVPAEKAVFENYSKHIMPQAGLDGLKGLYIFAALAALGLAGVIRKRT